jgi:hypothetical protein
MDTKNYLVPGQIWLPLYPGYMDIIFKYFEE